MTATAAPVGAVLPRHDFLRLPLLATARPDGFKEWQHFLVQAPGWRVLVNFSLAGETLGGRARLLPRMIVIAHRERWTGAVERYAESELDIAPDLCGLTIGRNRLQVTATGYQVRLDLPGRHITGELDFTPDGRPAVMRVNNQPAGEGRINWLFVPRLRATGTLRIGGRTHRLDGHPAYHDHNWGHFRWGDDFGWDWCSILPADPAEPWSLVFTRKTDRAGLRYLSQALYLWRHDRLAARFRDAQIRMRTRGLSGRAPDATLPPPMALVLGGDATDAPESVEITAADPDNRVRAELVPRSHVRLALPSETRLDRAVVLIEASGVAELSGQVGGEPIAAGGFGVLERLHG